ncbi:hypothetical protein PQ786_01765 [Alcaligenes faecalis]
MDFEKLKIWNLPWFKKNWIELLVAFLAGYMVGSFVGFVYCSTDKQGLIGVVGTWVTGVAAASIAWLAYRDQYKKKESTREYTFYKIRNLQEEIAFGLFGIFDLIGRWGGSFNKWSGEKKTMLDILDLLKNDKIWPDLIIELDSRDCFSFEELTEIEGRDSNIKKNRREMVGVCSKRYGYSYGNVDEVKAYEGIVNNMRCISWELNYISGATKQKLDELLEKADQVLIDVKSLPEPVYEYVDIDD